MSRALAAFARCAVTFVGARTLAVAGALTLGSCADARDLFRPYVPVKQEIEEVLAQPRPAPVMDAAIVLGCPAEADGSPSLCERCRVKTAVRQFRRGLVSNLVFSGGAAHSPDVEADVMGDLAVRRGVPPERVFREGRALTTWQNVRFSQRIAKTHQWHTILFISTADHLPRARRIALWYGFADADTAYQACDRDLPPDSDEEFVPPAPSRAAQPPTKTNG
jgi:uncharacterized SAM-binding protein YcdF (DUF218 family)